MLEMLERSCLLQTVVYKSYLWEKESPYSRVPQAYIASKKRHVTGESAEHFEISTKDRLERWISIKKKRPFKRNVMKRKIVDIAKHSEGTFQSNEAACSTFSRFLPVKLQSIEQRSCALRTFQVTSVAVWKNFAHSSKHRGIARKRRIQFSFSSKSRQT